LLLLSCLWWIKDYQTRPRPKRIDLQCRKLDVHIITLTDGGKLLCMDSTQVCSGQRHTWCSRNRFLTLFTICYETSSLQQRTSTHVSPCSVLEELQHIWNNCAGNSAIYCFVFIFIRTENYKTRQPNTQTNTTSLLVEKVQYWSKEETRKNRAHDYCSTR